MINNKKIVVTGGLGYIGSNAANLFFENGFEVHVLDEQNSDNHLLKLPNVNYHKIDLKDFVNLKNLLANINPVIVVHFAAKVSVFESTQHPEKYFSNNTDGTKNLLHAMSEVGCKYLIFSSTAAVYGNAKVAEVDEQQPYESVNPYGDSKIMAEKFIIENANKLGIKYVIFRYFNVAGANIDKNLGIISLKPTHAIPAAIQAYFNKQVFNVFGTDYPTPDGSAVRDYIHVIDLVNAHYLGFEWLIKHNQNNIFNLGSGHGYSVLEIVNELKNIINFEVNLAPRRDGDAAKVIANIDKAKTILNWHPKFKLDHIIKTEYEWRKKINK